MVIVIISIGTILFMGILVGCLTWLLQVEEKPQIKKQEAVILPPEVCGLPAPAVEAVSKREVVAEPTTQTQQPLPEPIAVSMQMQADETLKTM